MPEHTKLTVQFLSIPDALHQIVHTKILVVLRYDFYPLVVEENEILNIIQETFLSEQTINQISYTQSMFFYLLSVEFLLLVINT